MDTTIGQRFTQIISTKGITVNAFANSLGKPYSSVKVILDGTSKPGFEVLERVLTVYEDISRDWLLMGDGDMIRHSEKVEFVSQGDDYLHEHLHLLESNFARLAAQLESKDQQIANLQESQKSLQRMLESVLGKSEGVTLTPLSPEEIDFQTRFHQYRDLVLGNQSWLTKQSYQFSAIPRR